MKMALLVTPKMQPIPNNIKVLSDWGSVCIQINNCSDFENGDHMYVEGEEEAIKNWLRPFDTVWRQVGSNPMLQQFEACHIPLKGEAA